MAIKVTIAVACRNESAHIRDFLDSLACLDRTGLTLDAVIADGMSTDGTRQVLDEFGRVHPWCRIVDNPGKIVSTGLNAAIRLSDAEFIVRMDVHTLYEPDYVARSLAVLRSTGAANAGGPQRSRAHSYRQRAIHAGFHSLFSSGGAHFRDDKYRGPADTVPYGCWRRDYLILIGLFDETLVRNQDDELNLRIRLAGGQVWQDPSIVSWYSPRTTFTGLFRQYFQFGFWRVAVLRKYSGHGSARHFVPAAALLAGLCLLLFARPVLLALAAVYLLISVYASVRAAAREGWDLLPILPMTFATYQSAYALGFLAGLIYWSVIVERTGRRAVVRDKQMEDIERIRAEFLRRDRTIPPDFYAWHRPEIQYWQAQTARACTKLLARSGAFPVDETSILDVGCGTGQWLAEFLQWGARAANLHGIDLLDERIACARARLPSSDIRSGDARHLPWPDDSFDLVTQFAVFSSILDPGVRHDIAAEMLRVLRPGGRILCYDCRWSNPARTAVRGLNRADIQELFPNCAIDFFVTTLMPPLSRAIARHSWTVASALESLRFACSHLAALIVPKKK